MVTIPNHSHLSVSSILELHIVTVRFQNFEKSYEPQAIASVKFDNDRDVILCSKCNRTLISIE